MKNPLQVQRCAPTKGARGGRARADSDYNQARRGLQLFDYVDHARAWRAAVLPWRARMANPLLGSCALRALLPALLPLAALDCTPHRKLQRNPLAPLVGAATAQPALTHPCLPTRAHAAMFLCPAHALLYLLLDGSHKCALVPLQVLLFVV